MTAAVPDPGFRDQLAEVLKAHTVVAFAGCDSMCACDRKWRTNIAYREHLAAEVEARVQAAANQRAAEGGPLRCTYCGGSLRVNTEWTGLAYMQTQEPESIECDDCDATWEPDGVPREAAKWVRYPGLYAAPDRAAALARPAEPTGELLDDEWWLRLFHVTSEAVDFVPYDAASEYPVPHVAAFRAAAEPLLAPLLAKLRAVEALADSWEALACEYDGAAAAVTTPSLIAEAQGHAEDIRASVGGLRRALDAS